MNKTSLWIILIVTATWIGFLTGYAVSSQTGGAKPAADGAPASAGGYGAPASAGGYGK